ncbi:DUF1214 domain-containing protein [Myxococcus stipitatus]|uniref:DUF1214 domain-containing protein n=1 Tax=Myxococcus stipitatus TaxID=83455 RepID=UPI0030CDC486
MPQAQAFWSITRYDAKTQLLIINPIKRYLVNSAMMEKGAFITGDDGSITFYLQQPCPPLEDGGEEELAASPCGPVLRGHAALRPRASRIRGNRQVEPPLR